ncbi:glucose-6-phosphate isomerase [Arthrobacter gengyunqii]|uniref:Glucose-6-phosphate isomerase n=1 Tax=Arthrobacter gengyunqii TaxID=2886940 RepID=A0A9X1M159_9MICC|nr:glucose-6-phosphate isomerase [Arthrobacter gengyunqii]MCC3269301.1 glucose-6-phosphate isomerase [Arthrobacter gengyunqii]UOY94750.1 glucose-6-phosphate isomerase [Arthrobacter gengyunqii]
MTTLSFEAAGAALAAVENNTPALVRDDVAARLLAQDPTLWGPDAEAEASIRLGWLNPSEASRPLVGQIRGLREELAAEGVTRVVLAGMGGSSLAPEVITRTAGVDLTVLDSTDPDAVRAALDSGLAETVIVVSSKSGSTVETDSQRRTFEQAFTDAGIDAKSRIVVVTDPGSPLDGAAREAGYRAVFNADPNVGGRYSALTAFGLVPSGLAGADIEALLDDAEEALEILSDNDADNIGLQLGAALGGTDPLRNKIVIVDEGSGLAGFPDWAEQLIAESTGKLGTGLLPVVVEPGAPEITSGASDVLTARLVAVDSDAAPEGNQVVVAGSLGGQIILWEFATAVAGRLLAINPFDQPDVEAAKKAARGMLDARPEPTEPSFTDGAVEVRGPAELLSGARTLPEALAALLGQLGSEGYLSVQAYLDRNKQAGLAAIRPELAAATGRPVTFGWGPRFLHSTGQFHKGGPAQGVYLQITGAPQADLDIPGRPFTFGELITAQAAGDASVLADQGRPVLRLNFLDREQGVRELEAAVRNLAPEDGRS